MIILSASLLLLAAEPAAAPAPATQTPAAPAKERKICRKVDLSNSRMGRRECKTEAEWEAADRQSAGEVDLKQVER